MGKKSKEQHKATIKELRKEINRLEIESEPVRPFAKQKVITYGWLFLFPPYGLYKLFNQNSPFRIQEKIVWTLISLVYMIKLIEFSITI